MNNKWLILDCSYLCYRAYYAFPDLHHGDIATGITFGFFRDLVKFQDQFATDKIIFTFDFGAPLRSKEHPGYKATRQVVNKDELRKRNYIRAAREKLRETTLLQLGYRNVFFQEGYEADDIIASLCQSIPDDDEIIIISSDHDLYQLLSHRVSMYSPSSEIDPLVTLQSFYHKYGVTPDQWADVKAIAGCRGDNVIGIYGIGELKAISYLKGELKETSDAYKKIESHYNLWTANHRLVSLPYPGCRRFRLAPDELNELSWKKLSAQIGITTIPTLSPSRSTRRLHQA